MCTVYIHEPALVIGHDDRSSTSSSLIGRVPSIQSSLERRILTDFQHCRLFDWSTPCLWIEPGLTDGNPIVPVEKRRIA